MKRTAISVKHAAPLRRASHLLALEPRYVFDGAGGADVVEALWVPPVVSLNATDLEKDTETAPKGIETIASTTEPEAQRVQLNLVDGDKLDSAAKIQMEQALSTVDRLVGESIAAGKFEAVLQEVMVDGTETDPSQTPMRSAELMNELTTTGLQLTVELRSDADMQGHLAAYAPEGHAGNEVIYVNQDWLAAGAGQAWITQVMLEELGHALDQRLNPGQDSAGDEGELFAARMLNWDLSDEQVQQIRGSADFQTLTIEGVSVEVQTASLNFGNAYQMVYDLNNDTIINPDERWAAKEQNSHYFNASNPLGPVRISDGSGGVNFSGNDISATALVIGSTTYYGWVSRPIKANGLVRGFYFWNDADFGNLTAAQNDGNQDGDSNVTDNRGFLLVVDQDWFNEQIDANNNTPFNSMLINNAKDGNLGHIDVANVGSSSDRVDAALNSVMPPNSPPVAVNDRLTVTEDSTTTTVLASSGLLSNDSDINNDALTITGYTVLGMTGTKATGTTTTIDGVGDLRINSDGGFTFTPASNYNGPVPPITYTVSDGKGGETTAVLSITVDPVGDSPVSTNDALTIEPQTTVLLGLSDFGSYSDPDGDPLAKITITDLPSTGTLEYFNGSAWVAVADDQELTAFAINSGQLRLTTATTDTSIGFKVSDGSLSSSSSYTLAITVPAAPATPTATVDTGSGTAFEATEGVDGAAGTAATGNVLTNDTGSSIKVTGVFNTPVAAVGNTSIQGQYGTLTIGATGAYSYAPNNTQALVDALNVGGSLTESFNYTITDTNGNTATSTLTVKINGANDSPVARDDANSVKELAALTSGNYGTATGDVLINDDDVDNNTGLEVVIGTSDTIPSAGVSTTASATSPILLAGTTYTVVDVSGSQWNSAQGIPTSYTNAFLNGQTIPVDGGGSLQVKREGNGSSVVIVFDKPETLLKYPLETVFGAAGTTSTYKLTAISTQVAETNTITLTSSPTQPIVVGYAVTGTGIPANTTVTAINGDTLTLSNAVQITNRTLSFSDPSAVAPTAGAGEMLKSGTYGYLRIDENGTYTYPLTSNALNAGQTYTESFSYQTTDGTAQSNTATLRIVIDGTSAAFTISAVSDALTVAEGTQGSIANVLSNDPNTTAVTAYSWGGQSATSAGTTLTLTGVGTLSISSTGLLTFTPDGNYVGPVPSVTYTAQGAGSEKVSSSVAISITPLNDAPSGTNDAITIEKNTAAILTLGDFGTFSDVDGDVFSGIKVTTPPAVGTLKYNNGTAWVDVTLNQTISAADIAAGKLKFTPVTDAVGSNHATVGFEVFDGTTYSSSAYTLTVNVIDSVAASVGSPPVNTVPGAQTLSDYQTLAFTGLSVNDADNDITSTTLTAANGTLAVTGAGASGTGTANNPLVLTGNKATIDGLLATLVYTPSPNFSGADVMRMHTSDANGNTDTDFVNITVNTDSRALTVDGTMVNEASPYVYFQVTGVAGQKVALDLSTTGVGAGHAIEGLDHLPNLSYFNGATWISYTGGLVTVPAGNNLLVRTGVLQDGLNEGAETLKLIATNTAGTNSEGVSTIKDDGTGSIFLGNNSFTADTSGTGFPARLDDDRPIGVNNIAVNEASEWAMFTVSGASGQVLGLSLLDGTAQVGNGSPSDGSEDYSPTMEYWNGSTWAAYNGTSVTLAGSTLLVRTAVHNDNVYEGQEAFRLAVTKLSSGRTVHGTASIYDDGTGSIFAFDNNNDGTATITTGPGTGFDDDRTLSINSPLVNESSPYAIFTLTGPSGQTVSLQLQDESNNGTVAGRANILENQTLKIWDGFAWADYEPSNLPTFDGNGKIFVRVDIQAEQETAAEGAETFKLQATLTGRTTTVTGTATIIDDGTGSKYPGTFNAGSLVVDNTNLDDDSSPSINVTAYGPVNENSSYAMFTVVGSVGQTLNLSNSNGTASLAADALIEFSYDGINWSTYSATGAVLKPLVPANATVYVRVTITSESDAVSEGSETFSLVATDANAPSVSGSAQTSIVDNGTGRRYGPNMPSGVPAESSADLDDDRAPNNSNNRNVPPQPQNRRSAPTESSAAPTPPSNEPARSPERPVPADPNPNTRQEPVFNSALQSPASSAPVGPATSNGSSNSAEMVAPTTPNNAGSGSPPPLPNAPRASSPEATRPTPDAITSGAGYQIPVIDSTKQGLSILRGITDQVVESTGVATKISLPFDAFVHTDKNAVIALEAKLADDAQLPNWVRFDPATGVFEVVPPEGFVGKLDLKVVARDDKGQEVTAIFQMFIGQEAETRPQSRESLSEKLRMAIKRPLISVKVVDVQRAVPDPMVKAPVPTKNDAAVV